MSIVDLGEAEMHDRKFGKAYVDAFLHEFQNLFRRKHPGRARHQLHPL